MTASPADSKAGAGTRNVHDVLRRLIIEGELPPGSEISQLQLSRRLSVSRTPLREALRLLEREGLVEDVGPHRSVRISPLSMNDLDDLYSLRVMGEGLAVWLTVPMLRSKDFEQMEWELERAAPDGDTEAHSRFHAILRQGAGPRLRDHLERLFDHAERYQRAFMDQERNSAVFDAKLEEHRKLLEACRAGDRRLARDLLADHIAGTAITLMTAQRHAPFALPTALAMVKSAEDPPRTLGL
ncbi:transcriptional regulator [Actinomadura sp. NBRC 104412]|uniref:GntR family transcriptional regulator n=1 Tax=Actinomadura sp. NBRC 104412 TaxID=3032203 RepID=UPI0024A3D254|nr:GntR family transcriptional regulator [Actinomadura sp. NBRC 104412]GLZ09089.1 transcriptional regulator [Actinomadura sp. NBRC 104412]